MAKTNSTFLHFFLSLSLLPFILSQPSSNPEFNALMAFKIASDTTNKLSSWNETADLCTWHGVSCIHNRVQRLVLEGLDLRGSFQPLASLKHLHVLSLKRNSLSGTIPNLSNLTALRLLFLSHNEFSGDFPASVPSITRLFRLDLSYNNLSGQIPVIVNNLTHLLTLRLEENQFSGPIPSLNLPSLHNFNVSGNRLTGIIPPSLSRFPKTAFDNNLVLCGLPLASCNSTVTGPSIPAPEGAVASPVSPAVVSSSPTTKPEGSVANNAQGNGHRSGSRKMSTLAVIAIIAGDVLLLALVSFLLYCYFLRSYVAKMRDGRGARLLESQKIVYSACPYPSQGGCDKGKMVFFEEGGSKRFELEDLLRASAEMLGKGGFGTAYKAILDDGNVVAVKRLKEAQVGGKREFEQHMVLLGRLRHPNVVSLKAYYYARDEKLLVYAYMSNGSLFWLLHGNRGPGRTPLDWTTRLKIAAGAARGLAYIHHSYRSQRLAHGNIRSTNVLLDNAGNACVSDYGLSVFASPNIVPRSTGYRAPEVTDGRRLSQKADVYAFGVLLLELLTGKCPFVMESNAPGGGYGGVVDLPRWVQSVVREEWTAEVFDLELMRYKDIEEEMVGLLQIAMACTSTAPDQRPKMGYVVKMIEEIRGVEVSPSHESLDSVSDSPNVSDDTREG